jgi:hypothetical protein
MLSSNSPILFLLDIILDPKPNIEKVNIEYLNPKPNTKKVNT